MSCNRFSDALVVEPRPSRLLLGLAGLALVAGLCALALLPGTAPLVLGGPLLLALFAREARGQWHRPVLTWQASGVWHWQDGQGRWQGFLHPRTMVTPRVVVLVLTDGRRRRSIVLARDALERDHWRLLRAGIRVTGLRRTPVGV